ncbi:hypothetical protein GCM10027199_78130 [Amycolatopsis magusensis]
MARFGERNAEQAQQLGQPGHQRASDWQVSNGCGSGEWHQVVAQTEVNGTSVTVITLSDRSAGNVRDSTAAGSALRDREGFGVSGVLDRDRVLFLGTSMGGKCTELDRRPTWLR